MLAAFKYTLQFREQVDSLSKSLQLFAKACDEIVESDRLTSLLKRLLAVGNLMNESSGKLKASGITLDSLIKTATKKGSDGKTTVIDHLVSTAISNNLGLEKFWDDMPSVRDANKFSLEEFQLSIRELQIGAKNIENVVNVESRALTDEMTKPSKIFLEKLVPFYSTCTIEINSLQKLLDSSVEKAQRLRSFFAEDVKTSTSTIFGVMIDFAQLVERSKERHDRKENAVKRRPPTPKVKRRDINIATK